MAHLPFNQIQTFVSAIFISTFKIGILRNLAIMIGRAIMAFGTFEPEGIERDEWSHAGNFSAIHRKQSSSTWEQMWGSHAGALRFAFRRVLAHAANPATALVAQANALAAGAQNVEVHPIGLSDDNRDGVNAEPACVQLASVTPTGSPGIGISCSREINILRAS